MNLILAHRKAEVVALVRLVSVQVPQHFPLAFHEAAFVYLQDADVLREL
nr:hypothetical protein [Rufibacter sediminis]